MRAPRSEARVEYGSDQMLGRVDLRRPARAGTELDMDVVARPSLMLAVHHIAKKLAGPAEV